jgi:hypothetical protein
MKNISIYYNLTSTTGDRQSILPVVSVKGKTTITFVLTGINESRNYATYLTINYGDSTESINVQKDLVYDYKNKSIFNEVLFDKAGGTIMSTYENIYSNETSNFNSPLTAQFLITFRDGSKTLFIQPLNIYNASYYDEIGELSITNSQISPLSTSNTFINFEGKLNKQTYVGILLSSTLEDYYQLVDQSSTYYLVSPQDSYVYPTHSV